MTTQTAPAIAYSISTSSFTDYACEDCAVKFATEHGLTWNRPSHGFTIDEGDTYASEERFGECDYPATCGGCGLYLDVSLTSYGRQELAEGSGFPAWLLAYHLGDDHCQHPAPASFGASQVRDGVLVHDCAECGLVMAWTIS